MKYLPEEWSIRADDHFGAYSLTEATEPLICAVLLMVDRSARLQGSFKILLGGSDILQVDIPAQDALIMAGVASYRLVMERWPIDIIFNDNSTTASWFDLDESVADKSIKVTLSGGGDDTRKTLRRQLKKESTRTPNGAAFRWAVAATDNNSLELQLQSLPLPAATINAKPLLMQDDIAVNVVRTWPIAAEMFDGEKGLSGPVPVLFADQPEDLHSMLSRDPDSFYAEINKFMTK